MKDLIAVFMLSDGPLERTYAIRLGWEREEQRRWNLNPWDVYFLWPIA